MAGRQAMVISYLFILSTLFSAFSSQEDVSRRNFPVGFLFGTSSSAYQYEGAVSEDGKGVNNWDHFSRIPGAIKGGDNGDVAADHYHRYREDIDLMHSLGVGAYRFSISWARILPRGRFGDVNSAGISFYNSLIDYLVSKGITPFVTIHHADIPQELENRYGSWLSPQMQHDFVYFADICFRSFGDRVKHWITINEPNLVTRFSYLDGTYPPARCSMPFGNCSAGNSDVEPLLATHNMLLAHAKAADLYRKMYQQKQQGQIGISICASMYKPLREIEDDYEAVKRKLAFHIGWVLDPLIFGKYPLEMRTILRSLPKFNLKESRKLRSSIDFIGIQHYYTHYAKDCLHSPCDPKVHPIDGFVSVTEIRNGETIGEPTGVPNGYVVPDGLEGVISYVRKRYNNIPMFVTENGYPELSKSLRLQEENLNDYKRVEYHKKYLASLSKAIGEGADVRGYFIWSLLDNFEWSEGYSIRFGLHYIDHKTLRRIPKMSAEWYKNFLIGNKNRDDDTMVSLKNNVKYDVQTAAGSF